MTLKRSLPTVFRLSLKMHSSHFTDFMDKVLESVPLKEFGIKESDLDVFAGDVIKTQQRLLKNNYVQLSEDEILDIYKAAF